MSRLIGIWLLASAIVAVAFLFLVFFVSLMKMREDDEKQSDETTKLDLEARGFDPVMKEKENDHG